MSKISEDEETWTNLTEEEKKELITDLIAYRELKRTGARTNNCAAGMDCLATIGTFQTEVCASLKTSEI